MPTIAWAFVLPGRMSKRTKRAVHAGAMPCGLSDSLPK
jgi:hypothetical protein